MYQAARRLLLRGYPRDFWVRMHPPIRGTGLVFKTLLGGVAVAIGVVLSLPGVPGTGIPTILLSVA